MCGLCETRLHYAVDSTNGNGPACQPAEHPQFNCSGPLADFMCEGDATSPIAFSFVVHTFNPCMIGVLLLFNQPGRVYLHGMAGQRLVFTSIQGQSFVNRLGAMGQPTAKEVLK